MRQPSKMLTLDAHTMTGRHGWERVRGRAQHWSDCAEFAIKAHARGWSAARLGDTRIYTLRVIMPRLPKRLAHELS